MVLRVEVAGVGMSRFVISNGQFSNESGRRQNILRRLLNHKP